MNKVYKVRIYRIIINIILGVFVFGLSYYVSNIWLNQTYSMAVSVLVFLLYIYAIIISNLITVIINDEYMIVKKGLHTNKFDISSSIFKAKQTNSVGDSSYELTVIENDGTETYIDFDLIGGRQFNLLLEDLSIIGENASVKKIETKKKL